MTIDNGQSCEINQHLSFTSVHCFSAAYLIAEEVLMVISTEFRSRRDSGKVPAKQKEKRDIVSFWDHRNSAAWVCSQPSPDTLHSIHLFYMNSPSIQFTSKAAVFSLARKELGHDRLAENAAVTNHKGLSVGQPANGICVGFVIQNLVQAHRKDLGIVIFVIRVVSSGLLVGFTGAHGRVVEYGSSGL
eukprot:scaffold16707_cov182-Amphora_coffeaeformis.AAC.1